MLKFSKNLEALVQSEEDLILIAPQSHYKNNWHHHILGKKWASIFNKLLTKMKSESSNFSCSHYFGDDMRKITLIALREKISHSNSYAQKNEIYDEIAKAAPSAKAQIIVGLREESYEAAAVNALASLIQSYNRKSQPRKRNWHIALTLADGKMISPSIKTKALAKSLVWTCHLVDTPPAELGPEVFAQTIKKYFQDHAKVKIKVISGDKLLSHKLEGIYSVGKCANEKPQMVILEYTPSSSANKTVLLVGKGVTYDTGGLSLKISGAMCDMKSDMAGAAAVLGAFDTLATSKVKHRVIAIVGLVENAIGPNSYRCDDILTMHSGKTVEINNTDAEGRLVLADCLSYGCREYTPHLAIDAATLTGAQLVATGMRHAAFVTNKKELEALAHRAAQNSGDLLAFLPFAPEFFQEEFSSKVADMRNSVKNRMNAQTSCAAQFIYSHIEDLDVEWGHIDLAGPAFVGSRGTGYGVGLITEMVASYE